MSTNKIAILTSGGDSPGMNAAIRAVVRCALSERKKVAGIYEGYKGLMAENFWDLQWHDVAGILQRGGTILRTARFPEFKDLPVQEKAVDILRARGIDGLVVLGGDGSLTGALKLWEKFDFPVVGIPSTIDNDIAGTDYSLGADTALNLGVQALDRLRDTAESHKRVFVVEMFGNRSGYLVTHCGLAAGAAQLLVPEGGQVTVGSLDELAGRIRDWYERPVSNPNLRDMPRNAIVVLAEGTHFASWPDDKLDPNLNKIREVQERLTKKLKGTDVDCRIFVLGHIQRGGSPTAFDRILGARFGAKAVEVLDTMGGGYMVGLQGKRMAAVPIDQVLTQTRALQADPEANEDLRELIGIQKAFSELSPVEASLGGRRLLVLTSGANAPGMLMAIRAIVRAARRKGWQCFTTRYGFSSLIKSSNGDDIQELTWDDVHMGKMIFGGGLLGSDRTRDTQVSDEAIRKVWSALRDRQIDGLVVLGGIDAMKICQRLVQQTPPACPLLFLPATVNNNLPGTDICLGADTALNNLLTMVDKAKEAGLMLERIYIVPTMGRISSWLALHTALATGAEAVLDFETGFGLDKLGQIAAYLKKAFKRPGREAQRTAVVLLSEYVMKMLGAQAVRDILELETGRHVRIVQPGQMQRGGPPTAFDRALGARLGFRAVEELAAAWAAGHTDPLLVGWTDGRVSVNSLTEVCRQLPPDHPDGITYGHAIEDHELLAKLSYRPE